MRRSGLRAASVSYEGEFLSTLTAARRHRAKAVGVVLVLSALFVGTAPFAKQPLPAVWGFIPMYQAALVTIELITAVMLFGQFRYLGSASLLVLASGYLFSASMAVAHAISFPGLFSDIGWISPGAQTTAWLYFAWHAGFPLFLIAYSRLGDRRADSTFAEGRRRPAIVLASLGVVTLAAALGWLTFGYADALPIIMQGNSDGSAKVVVATATWVLSLLALIVLWTQHRHTVLDIWCMVVAVVWIFEIALAAVLNGARFDLGFYAGRVYGLLAGSFVLCVLLIEHSRLFAQLVAANGRERSERAAAEEKSLELSALNRELDAFTFSVSHDLRAPLRAINGYSAILDADHAPKLDDEGRRMLGAVRKASMRMDQMIEGLLHLARLGRAPLQTRPTNLDRIVQERVEELRQGVPGRTPDIKIGALGTVLADETLLQNVLDNLIGNALKYTRDAPQPTIEIGRLGAPVEHGEAVFFVRDNGAGFDMNYADKLFGVFQRLHSPQQFEGHGIGLAIVQRVISRHGGRVWAQSRPGAGATFFFTLGPASIPADTISEVGEKSVATAALQGAR